MSRTTAFHVVLQDRMLHIPIIKRGLSQSLVLIETSAFCFWLDLPCYEKRAKNESNHHFRCVFLFVLLLETLSVGNARMITKKNPVRMESFRNDY